MIKNKLLLSHIIITIIILFTIMEEYYCNKNHNLLSQCMDILIPYSEKDYTTFIQNGGLKSILKFVHDIRFVYIVSKSCSSFKQFLLPNNKIKWINESTLNFLKGKKIKNGWWLQQLIKLMVPTEIKGICDNVLVMDSDVIFLKDIFFIEKNNNFIKYSYVVTKNIPKNSYLLFLGNLSNNAVYYLLHLNSSNLDPKRTEKDRHEHGVPFCNVNHMMVFQKDILHLLYKKAEKVHNKSFIDVFLSTEKINYMLISEYDMYFSFVKRYFPERMNIIYPTYLHARSFQNCSREDIKIFQKESNIIYMTCHRHWDNFDICYNGDVKNNKTCSSSGSIHRDDFCSKNNNHHECIAVPTSEMENCYIDFSMK